MPVTPGPRPNYFFIFVATILLGLSALRAPTVGSCTFASGPILIWFARRGSLRPLLLWIAERGLLETSSAANANTINEMEIVEFNASLFADPLDPSDSRPQGECCICLESYDGVKQISRTPCGHILHRECLGMWLRIDGGQIQASSYVAGTP